MGSLVIVAIPREDDPVWKVSSEKVPHLTILFLGENSDNPNKGRIFEFLEHAANTSLTRFGLDVDRRGELGGDKADVLFFKKDRWSFPKINDFRSALLQDNTIREAFESADQFPVWNPHITLGYPATPAKKPAEDRLYWVNFDRIALWDGDFEGTELLLKDDVDLEVSMSDTAARGREFLSHHGVKGMRWGVRRSGINIGKIYRKPPAAGGVKKARKAPTSADFKKAEASRRKVGVKKTGPAAKKTATLSNEELQALVKRMNLEKQYAELSTKDQTKASGAMITGKILGGLGKGAGQVAGNIVKSQATNLGNQLAKEQIEKLLKNAKK